MVYIYINFFFMFFSHSNSESNWGNGRSATTQVCQDKSSYSFQDVTWTMDIFQRLHHVHIKRLLLLIAILAAVLSLVHLFAYPYRNYFSVFSVDNARLVSLPTLSKAFSNNSELADSDIIQDLKSDRDHALSSDNIELVDTPLEMKDRNLSLVPTNEPKFKDSDLVEGGAILSTDTDNMPRISAPRKRGGKALSIAQMNSLVFINSVEKKLKVYV